MRRAVWLVTLAACGPNTIKLQHDACAGGDSEACLASAKERFAAKDTDAARDYLEKQIALFEADTSCLPARGAVACFHGVVAVLREPAAGLLADYAIDPELLHTLGPWTGSDVDGPHGQARHALALMCKQHGDPIA